MTRKALLLLVLIGSLSMSLWAQQCNGFHWFVSGGLGSGSSPDYSLLEPGLSSLQAQYGGVGPVCSAEWVQAATPPTWSGGCATIPASCTYTPPPVGGCSTCNTAGEPIDLGDGDTFIQQTDVRLPGLGGGLTLTRTWNSATPFGGISGWIRNFDEQVYPGTDGTMKYQRGDGSVWSFGFYGNQPVYPLVSPANGQATMTELLQGNPPLPIGWMVTFQNGEQRIFYSNQFLNGSPAFDDTLGDLTQSGKLNSIIDRNGNTTSLNYGMSPPKCGHNYLGNYVCVQAETSLLSVTDATGRHLYFNYDSSGSVLTNVTSDPGTGINVTYTYATPPGGFFHVLTQVTQADNTFVTFNYDVLGNILSVTDTNGKVLESHTYDAMHRGLSSSRANGVDALAITYP